MALLRLSPTRTENTSYLSVMRPPRVYYGHARLTAKHQKLRRVSTSKGSVRVLQREGANSPRRTSPWYRNKRLSHHAARTMVAGAAEKLYHRPLIRISRIQTFYDKEK